MTLLRDTGPLRTVTGRFLVCEQRPERLLYVEAARGLLRVRFGGRWIAESEHATVLHAPGRRPVSYFPCADVRFDTFEFRPRTTDHPDLGPTGWYAVRVGDRVVERAAWHHLTPPRHAGEFAELIGFSARAISLHGEDAPVVSGVDVRASSSVLTVRSGQRLIATSSRPSMVHVPGGEPRWYLPRADVDLGALRTSSRAAPGSEPGSVCYDVAGVGEAAWSGPEESIAELLCFDPGKLDVRVDGRPVPAATAARLDSWTRFEPDGTVRVGITRAMPARIGRVTSVVLPAVGATVLAGQVRGEIDASNGRFGVTIPATGVITRVNELVTDCPEILDQDPCGQGWLFTLRATVTTRHAGER